MKIQKIVSFLFIALGMVNLAADPPKAGSGLSVETTRPADSPYTERLIDGESKTASTPVASKKTTDTDIIKQIVGAGKEQIKHLWNLDYETADNVGVSIPVPGSDTFKVDIGVAISVGVGGFDDTLPDGKLTMTPRRKGASRSESELTNAVFDLFSGWASRVTSGSGVLEGAGNSMIDQALAFIREKFGDEVGYQGVFVLKQMLLLSHLYKNHDKLYAYSKQKVYPLAWYIMAESFLLIQLVNTWKQKEGARLSSEADKLKADGKTVPSDFYTVRLRDALPSDMKDFLKQFSKTLLGSEDAFLNSVENLWDAIIMGEGYHFDASGMLRNGMGIEVHAYTMSSESDAQALAQFLTTHIADKNGIVRWDYIVKAFPFSSNPGMIASLIDEYDKNTQKLKDDDSSRASRQRVVERNKTLREQLNNHRNYGRYKVSSPGEFEMNSDEELFKVFQPELLSKIKNSKLTSYVSVFHKGNTLFFCTNHIGLMDASKLAAIILFRAIRLYSEAWMKSENREARMKLAQERNLIHSYLSTDEGKVSYAAVEQGLSPTITDAEYAGVRGGDAVMQIENYNRQKAAWDNAQLYKELHDQIKAAYSKDKKAQASNITFPVTEPVKPSFKDGVHVLHGDASLGVLPGGVSAPFAVPFAAPIAASPVEGVLVDGVSGGGGKGGPPQISLRKKKD